ncbi:MAG: glycerol-3-phosphate dehydrogenase (NAD(P)+) [Myxococcota bacterium]|jgi:glycerol-3-phosphate dehydrogenase (NAD(P)+)
MRVGILGGGRWGQALARLVMAAGHEPLIAYQGRRPPQILRSTSDPPEVSAACDLLVVATSASETRRAIRLARPGPGNRVVLAGRGIEPGTGEWLADVVQTESDVARVGALAGPAPVDEILNGGLCAGVVASSFADVRQLATEALHSSRYRVYDTDDLMGVQLAGAMVPVLAAVIGMAVNLQGSGVGMHALVVSRSLSEAGRLARAVGADPLTFAGLAGVGDLVAAQARPGHPSFEAGANLAHGRRDRGPLPIARALVSLADRHGIELPLTQALVTIYDGADPLDVVQDLMARAAVAERS